MTLSASEVTKGLELFEIKPGTQVRLEVLKDLLPDMTTALFFGKIYKLNYTQLSTLLRKLFNSTVIQALLNEGDKHSTDLQSYIINTVPAAQLESAGITPSQFSEPLHHELLPELWEQLEVEVAASIEQLVSSLDTSLGMVQGKYGRMIFSTLAQISKQRAGVLGVYRAQIKHEVVPDNLVIFDVSGSVTQNTASKIINEVIALSYKANATLAIVSNNTFYWEPGTYRADTVMAKAEFGGTHYETLADLLQKDWSTVITIADYDSGWTVSDYLFQHCKGRIEQVLDISLVNRPTYLAECVGRLANKVTPLLVGNSDRVLGDKRRTWGW